MRLSQMLFVTLRDDPADAEIPSHKLLLRAGYIRRIGSGIYAYLPLMWRVLQKVSQIVREEMNATGAQECLLPQLQPAELWQESGRWDTYTKAEGIMFSLVDRREQQLGLGPTHEEVITTVARDMIRSYRQLPVHLYQIQTKFRDEIRPRFGLMRGREFIMKDGYSFHADEESLKKTYQEMYTAYSNMLRRSGLAFRAVEADSGAIGGSGSTEFMVLADAGEDEVLYTEDGKYAANVEKAVSLPAEAETSPFTTFEKRETPGTDTIKKLCNFLKCSDTQVVKNVLYKTISDKGWTFFVLVSIRGDQDINEVKLQNEYLRKFSSNEDLDNYPEIRSTVLKLELVSTEEQNLWFSRQLPQGYIGPNLSDDYLRSSPRLRKEEIQELTGLTSSLLDEVINADLVVNREDYDVLSVGINIRKKLLSLGSITIPSTSGNAKMLESVSLMNAYKALQNFQKQYPYPLFRHLLDKTVVNLKNFVTGANESGYHVVGANWGEQIKLLEDETFTVDIRKARPGEHCEKNPSQTLQTARGIEAGHIFQLGTKYSEAMGATYTNEQGEEKPLVMGCYGVGVSRLAQSAVEQSYDKDGIIWPIAIAPYHAIITIPNIKDVQQIEVAEKLYTELNKVGVETLLDDRDERAGVKFKDADLIGIPFRIVTGRAITNGKVEIVKRATRESQEIAIEEVINTLQQWINEAIAS